MKIRGTEIYMIRGDTEVIRVSMHDIEGQPVAMESGDTIYLTIKTSPYTNEKVLQKIVTEFSGDGEALINIDPADTKSHEPQSYYYDVQLTKADGTVKTIINPSKFHLLPEVTYE